MKMTKGGWGKKLVIHGYLWSMCLDLFFQFSMIVISKGGFGRLSRERLIFREDSKPLRLGENSWETETVNIPILTLHVVDTVSH